MGDVVDFQVKPKSLSKSFKGHKYNVTYTPANKHWAWCVELVTTTVLRGECDTQVKAVREAERQIDKVLKVQGRDVG